MRRYYAIVASACWASPTLASETVTFTYDTLGRLTIVSTVGGPNGGLQQTYVLDPASNRTTYTVSGSQNHGRPDAPAIVLPVNGFTIVPVELQ